MPASSPRRKPASVDIASPIAGSPAPKAAYPSNSSSGIIEPTIAKAIDAPRAPPAVTVSQGCRYDQLLRTGSVTPFMESLSILPPSNRRRPLALFAAGCIQVVPAIGSTGCQGGGRILAQKTTGHTPLVDFYGPRKEPPPDGLPPRRRSVAARRGLLILAVVLAVLAAATALNVEIGRAHV